MVWPPKESLEYQPTSMKFPAQNVGKDFNLHMNLIFICAGFILYLIFLVKVQLFFIT